MNFLETALEGVFEVVPSSSTDHRGDFVKYFDASAFEARGLSSAFHQGARAANRRRGTLRGLHYQETSYFEVKLVRCVRGAIFDVLVDMRPGSRTCGDWQSFELASTKSNALYIPSGVAHGYQTYEDETVLEYLISGEYRPDMQRGIRWNSELLGIAWPLEVTMISARDEGLPEFSP